MDRAAEILLIERALDLIARKGSEMAPSGHAQPVAFYADPAQYSAEIERIFRRAPQPVAFAAELRNPGDFVTRDVAGVPLLAARDRAGALHGFLNVCRHRGSRVEWAEKGTGRHGFVCPYHNWSYGADGRLLGMPHAEGFPELDRAQHGLVAVPVSEAAGLIWAAPDPAPIDFAAWRSPLLRELETFVPSGAVPHGLRHYDLKANWKLTIDASLDAYHFVYAHRATVGPMFFDTMAIFDRDDLVIRMVLPKRSLAALREQPKSEWRIRDHANLIYAVFPGTVFLVEPDHIQVMISRPQGVARTGIDGAQIVPEPPASDKARLHWDKNAKIFWDAIEEDFALMESMAATLGSGANAALTFGRFEHANAWFHASVARRLND